MGSDGPAAACMHRRAVAAGGLPCPAGRGAESHPPEVTPAPRRNPGRRPSPRPTSRLEADADEKFVQAVQRRAQMGDKVRRFEQTLSRQAAALDRLNEVTEGSQSVAAVGAAPGKPGTALAAQGTRTEPDPCRDRARHQHRVRGCRRTGDAARGLAGHPRGTLPVARAGATLGRTDRADRRHANPAGRPTVQAAGPGPQEQRPGDAGAKGRVGGGRRSRRTGPAAGDDGHATAVAGDPRSQRARADGHRAAPQPGHRDRLRARFRCGARPSAAAARRLCRGAAAADLLAAPPRQEAGRGRPVGRSGAARAGLGPGRPGCCWWPGPRCCMACKDPTCASSW